MRRDLIIATALSACLHGSIVWFGGTATPAAIHAITPAPPPASPAIVLPPEDTDDTQVSGSPSGNVQPSDPGLPTLPDIIAPRPDSSDITQTIEPPAPGPAELHISTIVLPGGSGDDSRGAIGTVFNPKDLDEQPSARSTPNPVYPREMQLEGVSSTVTVGFVLDEHGNVHDAHAIASSNSAFDDAAVAAVSRWKFHPGSREGRPVKTRMQVPISFNCGEDR